MPGAIKEYRAALDIDPKDVKSRNNLGVALEAVGDLDGAVREYRAALALLPSNQVLKNNVARAVKSANRRDAAIAEAFGVPVPKAE